MVNQTMKFDVGRTLDPSVMSKWIWWMGMVIRFTSVEGIILNRIIELILWRKYSNSHIWIWIFTNDSNNLESDATRWRTAIWSYCKWFHSKIVFIIQMVTKIMIWLNLKVASVCTFQVWNFFVLECSTYSEESIDYKFVAIGSTEQKLWIKWCL
jgi:hypothetical protein